MESVAEITNVMFGSLAFESLDGECETHGKSTIMLPKRLAEKAWHCPQCAEEKAAAETRSRWLADRAATLHKIAHIPPKYQGQKFTAVTKEQKAVRGTVKAFRDAITASPKWAVLVLFGTVGTGKTLLASELAESLINNMSMSVRYCTANQMISEIQASYSKEGKSEEGEIDRFAQYDVLILDEIDAKRDTENANLLLTEVINRRYNAERSVVIITNQPFNNLSKYVGDRVDDRLHENAFVCALNWPSFRRADSLEARVT